LKQDHSIVKSLDKYILYPQIQIKGNKKMDAEAILVFSVAGRWFGQHQSSSS